MPFNRLLFSMGTNRYSNEIRCCCCCCCFGYCSFSFFSFLSFICLFVQLRCQIHWRNRNELLLDTPINSISIELKNPNTKNINQQQIQAQMQQQASTYNVQIWNLTVVIYTIKIRNVHDDTHTHARTRIHASSVIKTRTLICECMFKVSAHLWVHTRFKCDETTTRSSIVIAHPTCSIHGTHKRLINV